LERGIRLAQLAELGSETADALGVAVLDESGRRAAVTMGSYGMDVTRALAAIVEQTHDDLGLCWPRSIAPADVHVVATGKDSAVFVAADQLARDVEGAGLRVLLDDRRGVSPGVKFADAELFGVPTIVVVGKLLAQGEVEVRDRRTGRRSVVPVAAAVPHIAT
jgi:prolyl-tRNA synthetase